MTTQMTTQTTTQTTTGPASADAASGSGTVDEQAAGEPAAKGRAPRRTASRGDAPQSGGAAAKRKAVAAETEPASEKPRKRRTVG